MQQPAGRAKRRGGGERKPREERWTELLQVATEVFYEKGYDAASLQDIADRLGMLKGSLYYYIRTKEDLLYEVINDQFQQGLANIQSLASQPGDPVERLYNIIVGHIDYTCRRLTGTAVLLHELDSLSADRQKSILGGEDAYRSVFVDLIRQGQERGLIRAEVDPRLASLSILGSLNWLYRWFRPGGEFSGRQIGSHFADMNVRGIATERALAVLPSLAESGTSGKRRTGTKSRTSSRKNRTA